MSGVARKVEVTGAQLVSNIGSRWQKPSVLTVKPIRIHDIHVFTSIHGELRMQCFPVEGAQNL